MLYRGKLPPQDGRSAVAYWSVHDEIQMFKYLFLEDKMGLRKLHQGVIDHTKKYVENKFQQTQRRRYDKKDWKNLLFKLWNRISGEEEPMLRKDVVAYLDELLGQQLGEAELSYQVVSERLESIQRSALERQDEYNRYMYKHLLDLLNRSR